MARGSPGERRLIVIGGRRPLSGRKVGDRRIRIERPHSAYFRYTGPGQLTAKPAASVPKTAIGRAWSRAKARRHRATARKRGGDGRTPFEDEGAGGLQLRCDQLVDLRDGGDPSHPGARGRQRPGVRSRDRPRDRPPAGHRRDLLPPGLHGLSVRGRRVRRRPGQPQPARRAPGCRRAALRLRHDRRRVGGGRDRRDHLGGPGAAAVARRDGGGRDLPAGARQPSGAA